MKPGDLCKLVGTFGLGDLCIVLELNAGGLIARVLLQNGSVKNISPRFLEVCDEAG